MNDWNELLSHLAEHPRENGTPVLQQIASYLAEAFRTSGIESQRFTFSAHLWLANCYGRADLQVIALRK